MEKRPLILITNDDSIHAKGIAVLTDICRPLGDVVVVAPDKGQSGKSHAVSFAEPLFLKAKGEEPGLKSYTCSGTPADCVKLGVHKVLDRHPDLLVSGINHGTNSSVSVVYSGTMAAAMEGCLNKVPSIGFSLLDHREDADFSECIEHLTHIIQNVLENGLPPEVCLNVNIPKRNAHPIKGIRVCRQTKGKWAEEFDERAHPYGVPYYWLMGKFENYEPLAEDTDEWALANHYISLVPIKVDFTCNQTINLLKEQNYER